MKNVDYSLMFVTDDRITDDEQFLSILEASLKGGASIIQLREKTMNSKCFYERAMATKALCDRYETPLIVNDRVDIAMAVNADGVHIGQTDLSANVVRKLLGNQKIIGWSVSNDEQAEISTQLDIDYIGLSPIFGTSTKTVDLDPPLEIEGLKRIQSISNKPIVCIGGITKENTASILQNGASGIAVVSAISQAINPKEETEQLKKIICQTGTKK
ncbi:MAG: thiamine phosphate synthase [Flavobacteriales bacterium]|nr:thiamine phosphate synthase [Flavobacteriales bacterium]